MSNANAISLREPVLFACGDALIFQRLLRDYLPSDGWSLKYDLRGPDGSVQLSATSTASGDYHLVSVMPFAAALDPGDYVLAGYAVNGTERHQMYLGELTLQANLDQAGTLDALTTHAQRMIPLIEAQLERLAAHELEESNVQQTLLIRAKRMDLERQLALNKEIRANEIAQENMRNGRGSGNVIRGGFLVTS